MILCIGTTLDLLRNYMSTQRTNYGKFSVKHEGSETWNNLPILLKQIKAPHTFKVGVNVNLNGILRGLKKR